MKLTCFKQVKTVRPDMSDLRSDMSGLYRIYLSWGPDMSG
jgi:hypothetical protein